MRRVFIDTAFLIARYDPRDSLHQIALRLFDELDSAPAQFFTSHLVLAEFLAYFSRSPLSIRRGAAEYVTLLLNRPDLTVVDLTPELFRRGFDLYRARPDKRYSLADCVSMTVCADLSITEVLTSDTDFESEGLEILLKD